MSQDYDDEDYYLPLEDQRVFGAGIRRKHTFRALGRVAYNYRLIFYCHQHRRYIPLDRPKTTKCIEDISFYAYKYNYRYTREYRTAT